MSVISLDTETTGVYLHHGCKPFLVTSCDLEGKVLYWEWDVDPLTRNVDIPGEDIEEIEELIASSETIYLQNAKFDAHALRTIGIQLPWDKVRDTLCMGHLLASNHPHDLTSMCIEYLGIDIGKYEKKLEEIVKACRNTVRRNLPDWRIADDESSDVSFKGDWHNDYWLPRALAWYYRSVDIDMSEEWWTVTSNYANADSSATVLLGVELEKIIQSRKLWNIYQHRLQLPKMAYEMECRGVTVIGSYTEETIDQHEQYVAEAADELCCIAASYGHELELAEGASLNDNMRGFFYGSIQQYCPSPKCKYTKTVKHWNGEVVDSLAVCPKCEKRKKNPQKVKLVTTSRENLNLKVINNRKSGNASLDKYVMDEYLATLDGEALRFVKLLADKRRHDTDLTYMHAYRRFWLPIEGSPGYYRIHPNLNPFATDHLRWGSNTPNLQNVGKQEEECEEEGCDGKGCIWCNYTGKVRVSVRNCYGPAPGREIWTMDFQNIELRIPAYESEEEAMIELFEKPNEPPYFGSYHCLNASIVYPDLFWPLAEKDGAFKKKYKATEYQWCKNGGFALQYGCGERKADQTFRRKGAYRALKEKLPKVAALNDYYVKQAERIGYVETLPDKTIEPARGYPVLASRTDDGRVLSTTPFNYHVSGTACWCKNTALIRCAAQLEKWRREEGFDAYLSLEIHDELLFDFPRGATPEENLPKALILKGLMEESGENLIPRIPTPVTVEYHTKTWAEGKVMAR